MRMKKAKQTLARFIGTAFAAAFLLANTVSAQTQPALQPAQGAQMSHPDALPQASAPVVVETAPKTAEKAVKKAPQLAMPANATEKQAKQIVKVNAALAKATEKQAAVEVKQPGTLQKAVARMEMKRLSKKLDKMVVEKTTEIKEMESKSAAQALDTLTLVGLILAIIGLIFLLAVDGTLGAIFLVIGLVLLLIGLVNNN